MRKLLLMPLLMISLNGCAGFIYTPPIPPNVTVTSCKQCNALGRNCVDIKAKGYPDQIAC